MSTATAQNQTPVPGSDEYNRAFMRNALSDPNGFTLADLFEATADKYPERPSLWYVGCEVYPEKMVSFRELDAYSNQIARWAKQEGLVKGDVVALYMHNRIEYIATWIGLCKIGVKIAFINNTIKMTPLIHSISIAKSKMVIFGKELEDSMRQVHEELSNSIKVTLVCFGGSTDFCRSIDHIVKSSSTERLNRTERQGIKFGSVCGYIYTSGTTGLPKAVNITHLKQWASAAGYGDSGLSCEDVIYSSGLPLYHGSALSVGTGMMLYYGACQVIRKKFSASKWLSDVRRYRVTVVQYIGELCRYVLNGTPEKPDDSLNSIRLATGNGLAKEIWVKFQTRFGIDTITEFYGATDANGGFRNSVYLKNLLNNNYEGVGCIGRIDFSKKFQKMRFVKYDILNDDVVRQDGKLVDCVPGEAGECLFLQNEKMPISSFTGYTDKAATNKKFVTDNGLTFVRTGDLLSFDSKGWIRFVDRIGDTFRWRGENVSTAEVSSEISKNPIVAEANVYGVQVPGIEGRAGCAAIVLKNPNLDVATIASEIIQTAESSLPSYAVPVFIRIQEEAPTTQTFKHQKVKLREQGIDPEKIGDDKMLWLHPDNKKYVQFTSNDYKSLFKNDGIQSRL